MAQEQLDLSTVNQVDGLQETINQLELLRAFLRDKVMTDTEEKVVQLSTKAIVGINAAIAAVNKLLEAD